MKEYKIAVADEEMNTNVQEKAFELGYAWPHYNGKSVFSDRGPYLYMNADGSLTHGSDLFYHVNHSYKEITYSDFMALTPEKKTRPMTKKELIEFVAGNMGWIEVQFMKGDWLPAWSISNHNNIHLYRWRYIDHDEIRKFEVEE